MPKQSTLIRLAGPGPEYLFVALPLVVLTFVFIVVGKELHTILASAEWSFGAAILFGQSITKLVSGVARHGVERADLLALIIAVVIVFGLCPSLTVLALVLAKEEPDGVLVVSQLVLFTLGSGVFFVLGSAGNPTR